jgi:hypothetical protein
VVVWVARGGGLAGSSVGCLSAPMAVAWPWVRARCPLFPHVSTPPFTALSGRVYLACGQGRIVAFLQQSVGGLLRLALVFLHDVPLGLKEVGSTLPLLRRLVATTSVLAAGIPSVVAAEDDFCKARLRWVRRKEQVRPVCVCVGGGLWFLCGNQPIRLWGAQVKWLSE